MSSKNRNKDYSDATGAREYQGRSNNGHRVPRDNSRVTLADALRTAGVSVRDSKPVGILDLDLPATDSWEGDGEDVVVIGLGAETRLGRMLSLEYDYTFEHNLFGKFQNLIGFWYFIRSTQRLESLRYMMGTRVAALGKVLKNRPIRHVRAMVMDCAYQRIMKNDDLKELMKKNTLPIDMYYEQASGTRIRQKHALWIVVGYNEIQKALHENREPDFSQLCTSSTNDIYEDVRPTPSKNSQRILAEKQARQQQREESSSQRQPAAVNKPVTEKPQNKDTPKPTRELVAPGVTRFNVPGHKRYCPLIPVLDKDTESLFVKGTGRKVFVGDVEMETGLLLSDANQPLILLSNHHELLVKGMIHENDVFRGGTILAKSFVPGFSTTDVMMIHEVALLDAHGASDSDSKSFIFPLRLRILATKSDNDSDRQIVQRLSLDTMLYQRVIELRRSLDSFQDKNCGLYKAMVEKLPALEASEKYGYGLIKADVTLIVCNTRPYTVKVTGSISAIGLSSGPTPGGETLTHRFDESEVVTFPIEGFTVNLCRGLLRTEDGEPVETSDAHETEVATSQENGEEALHVTGAVEEPVLALGISDSDAPAMAIDKGKDEDDVVLTYESGQDNEEESTSV